jgi:hypothetical protein
MPAAWAEVLDVADYAFTVVFFVEMLLKMVAYNVALGSQYAYLRSGWNQIDFVVVTLTVRRHPVGALYRA